MSATGMQSAHAMSHLFKQISPHDMQNLQTRSTMTKFP